MSSAFKAEGFDETDRALADLSRMADSDVLIDIGEDALQPIADAARGMVRQRTGRLARSIGVGTQLSPRQAALFKPDPGTIEVYVGAGSLPQAITEEFGTYREAAHPFMRPAWDSRLAEAVTRLRAAAGERLRRIVRG